MKVKVPLALLLLVAGAVGYLLGTESGRSQRDVILVKMGRKQADSGDAENSADETAASDASVSDEAGEPETS